ncbi:hypothetical protein FJT64_007460 [Amphibalanus amphitrite]|uniref:Uncharacterized protein n=1 Tax=Amphibalanus amphitrite TaxID=1232801 RepID=A0A6A4VMT2_AMPAM|nr:hypothetical protein FJT64_007460 [Amphibalanus amphitrite]
MAAMDGLMRPPATHLREGGSITQGTPMQPEPRRRDNPTTGGGLVGSAEPGAYTSRAGPGAPAGYPYPGGPPPGDHLSSRHVLITDYITSQQMHGRRDSRSSSDGGGDPRASPRDLAMYGRQPAPPPHNTPPPPRSTPPPARRQPPAPQHQPPPTQQRAGESRGAGGPPPPEPRGYPPVGRGGGPAAGRDSPRSLPPPERPAYPAAPPPPPDSYGYRYRGAPAPAGRPAESAAAERAAMERARLIREERHIMRVAQAGSPELAGQRPPPQSAAEPVRLSAPHQAWLYQQQQAATAPAAAAAAAAAAGGLRAAGRHLPGEPIGGRRVAARLRQEQDRLR